MPGGMGDSGGYGRLARALVIGDGAEARRAATEALAAVQARLLDVLPMDQAAARFARQAALELILVEAAGVPDARVEAALEQAVAAAGAHRAALVVTLAPEQIDLVWARVEPGTAELLCAPSPAERVAAIMLALRRRTPGRVRDDDGPALQRLGDEVARIADALERLTGSAHSASAGPGVRDAAQAYRGAEEAPLPGVGAAELRGIIRARRMRADFFDAALFADPAWDMLLDLFAAELEGRRVSVSSLCIAAAVPPTTALRWIETMRARGLLERHDDLLDRRRAYVTLAAAARNALWRYLAAVRDAGLVAL